MPGPFPRPLALRHLCPFLLALSLQAQPAAPLPSQTWVDLAGPWKISHEDDPRFASPEFDDSSWATTQLPGLPLPERGAAFFWLRRTFQLPPGVDRAALALTVGKLTEHYRLWINGTLVATVGDLTWANQQLARPRTFDLPPLSAGPLTIAVRAVRLGGAPSNITWLRFPDPGPYVITSRSNAPRHAGRDWLGNLRSLRAADLAVGVACFTLGLILLLMYLSERSRLEVLYLALYGLTLAWRRSEIFFGIGPETTPWRYHFSLAPLLLLFLGLFAARIFGLPWRWLPWVLFAGAALDYLQPSALAFRGLQLVTAAVLAWGTLRARDLSALLAGSIWLLFFTQALAERVSELPPSVFRLTQGTLVNAFGFNSPLHPLYAVVFLLAMVLVLTHRSLADNGVRQRLQGELEAARTVQTLLLPTSAPGHVEAVYLPAQEVGGDFWHCYDGRLIVVGDVSGKGLKAAMIVSLVTGALANRRSDSPAALLAELNTILLGKAGFVTCCIVRIETDGRITVANAGHPAPYRNGQELDLAPGLPLGVVPEAEYSEAVFAFDGPLTLVSDGVIEAANPKGELFGFERTRDVSTQSAQEIADAAKSWGQNDDITVVTVRRAG